MEKSVAILQSNYIPWKGYFDIINSVDEFVIYDTAQYTKNDWRNRNKIKTIQGVNWLTIPVKHSTSQEIREIQVLNNKWQQKHWRTLLQNYSKSKYFNIYKDIFENLYLKENDTFLSKINYNFILAINKILGINTKISCSEDYLVNGEKSEKLLNICKQSNATEYFSGPAAKNYLDIELFRQEDIKVNWVDYSGYKEYNQLHPPFEHAVSILDLIFNEGGNAKNFMKSF